MPRGKGSDAVLSISVEAMMETSQDRPAELRKAVGGRIAFGEFDVMSKRREAIGGRELGSPASFT
jgi:hypothetical protein